MTCEEITKEEGMAMLDRQARLLLGLSGEEFLAAHDRGDEDQYDHVDWMSVRILIPSPGDHAALAQPGRGAGLKFQSVPVRIRGAAPTPCGWAVRCFWVRVPEVAALPRMPLICHLFSASSG